MDLNSTQGSSRQRELELVDHNGSLGQNIDPSVLEKKPDSSTHSPTTSSLDTQRKSLKMLALASMVVSGVQFCWALQFSLLTPYVQALGIQHAFSSFIWLCGPISGLLVQPCVGFWSDRCQMRFGRRRPFILAGVAMICIAVTTIGFSADIGYLLGDTKEHCSAYRGSRIKAAIIFIIGFWMLDVANNTVQGPARALLADLSGSDQKKSAHAIFCSWMALGNILGYSAGANGNWHRWFPFLKTRACCESCGNLKAVFILAVVYLILCTLMTLYFAEEIPLLSKKVDSSSNDSSLLELAQKSGPNQRENIGKPMMTTSSDVHLLNPAAKERNSDLSSLDRERSIFYSLRKSLRDLPPTMRPVLIVMALSWVAWFPFVLYDSDWMGREIYRGDPQGNTSQISAYNTGVRVAAFGLLLHSVVLGITSFLIESLCRWVGSRLLWAMGNFVLSLCLASIAVVSVFSIRTYSREKSHMHSGSVGIKIAALAVITVLGMPFSITLSIPFSITSELTADAGGGQGLSVGVLNLAIVIPQLIVSLGAGPLDALFGGGNVPAFVVASLFAFAASFFAFLKLPDSTSFKSSDLHFG